MTPKIVICGEVFSSNLGDQVIARSLEWAVRDCIPGAEVRLLDLSGRRKEIPADVAATGWRQELARRVHRLGHLSRCVLTAVAWFTHRRRRLRSRYEQELLGASLLLVGGGQLIADNTWSFPLHLDELTRCALTYDVPVVFFACGVGGNWSRVGLILAQRALKRSRLVFVRDGLSMKRVRALMGEAGVRTELTIDPALLAAQVFRPGARGAIIGLNVMSPDVVNRHTGQALQWTALKDLWVGLAVLLERDHVPFEFFTNGSPEDAEFCREVVMEAERRAGCRVDAFVPLSVDEFVARMSTYRSVVVHRLHAAIVAVAFKIPVVALSWDDKLQSFFDEIGLGSQVMPLEQATPQDLQTSIRNSAVTVSDAVLARAQGQQSAALQLAWGRASTAAQHRG